MAKVILFGGGDGGGIYIGPDGIRPIPPWDPSVRLQLSSIARLLRATRGIADEEVQRQVGGYVNELAGLAIGQVEGIVGPIDEADGLVYQDDDGVFTCGSTGKPPIFFPWPPRSMPGIEDLVAHRILEEDTLDFVNVAVASGANPAEVLRNPAAVAEQARMEVSPETLERLEGLKLARPDELEDPIDREIVEFFDRAVESGAAMERWATRPFEVANELGMRLSQEAAERIGSASSVYLGNRDPGRVMSPAAVAIVVVIVIVLWDRDVRVPVIDTSGLEKF
jgi:hypothetical protein